MKQAANKLMEELQMLYRKRTRIAEDIHRLERQAKQTCWGCPHTGSTTDLVTCEIGNVNYPYRCEKYLDK